MFIYGDRLNDLILDRIQNILSIPLDTLHKMTRRECVMAGLMDPVRVFVKNEPHKEEKVLAKRFRLIMSVSLADKIIEMLLVRHLTKLEIANWKHIPSKPGIGFTESDVEYMYKDVMKRSDMYATDFKAFDWNTKEWQILDQAEMVIKLANFPSEVWKHLMRAKAWLECHSVYQFSDGTLVVPRYAGIVNSGKFITSSGNSRIRAKAATLIGSDCVKAAGDDTVESFVPDAINKYLEYGLRCKGYDKIIDSFEFCSRLYHPSGSYAINSVKMIMNLLDQSPKDWLEYKQLIIGFQDELGSRPDFHQIMEQIISVGFHEVEGPYLEVEGPQIISD